MVDSTGGGGDPWEMTTIRELAKRYDTFMFDCDGVVWQADVQIGHAFEAIQWLEDQGKNVFFVTNTASKLPEDCAEKMRKMGFKNVKVNHIYTMASVIAKYVKRTFPDVHKVFCIGMGSIRKALEAEGIQVIGADQDEPSEAAESHLTMEEFDAYQLDTDVGAVVYGIDFSFNMKKLQIGALYLNERKVPLIATNDDETALIGGRYMPGAGATLQSLLAASGLKRGSTHASSSLEEPGTFNLIGKPNPFTVALIKEEHGIEEGSRTVMIGDRPNTDILFGKAAGVDQCLVMSGVVRGLEDFRQNWLPQDPQRYTPTYVMQMVGDLEATL